MATYYIGLTFEVKRLTTKEEAHDFGVALAEHVTDTFNDNNTIDPGVWIKVKKKRRAKS